MKSKAAVRGAGPGQGAFPGVRGILEQNKKKLRAGAAGGHRARGSQGLTEFQKVVVFGAPAVAAEAARQSLARRGPSEALQIKEPPAKQDGNASGEDRGAVPAPASQTAGGRPRAAQVGDQGGRRRRVRAAADATAAAAEKEKAPRRADDAARRTSAATADAAAAKIAERKAQIDLRGVPDSRPPPPRRRGESSADAPKAEQTPL